MGSGRDLFGASHRDKAGAEVQRPVAKCCGRSAPKERTSRLPGPSSEESAAPQASALVLWRRCAKR
eukprot:10567288-Alexandrium_andersonii.AAC.1